MTGAMETITADTILLIEFVGDSVHKGLRRHGLMEGSIKYTHLRQTWHQLLHGIHTLQVCGVMQWRKVRALLKGLQHLVGKDY